MKYIIDVTPDSGDEIEARGGPNRPTSVWVGDRFAVWINDADIVVARRLKEAFAEAERMLRERASLPEDAR